MTFFLGALAAGLMTLGVVRAVRRLGPSQIPADALRAGRVLLHAQHGEAGAAWDELGGATDADGLNLRFRADDDPAARARLWLPAADRSASRTGRGRFVALSPQFETHHVAASGHAFVVRLRGTAAVLGREVKLQLLCDRRGRPVCVGIENDDDHAPAVGGWIEIDRLALVAVGGAPPSADRSR